MIISLVALFIFIQRNWRRKNTSDLISTYNSNSDVEFSHVFFKIPIFSYKELQEATDNFSKDRLLGDGGFGTVYYGNMIKALTFIESDISLLSNVYFLL